MKRFWAQVVGVSCVVACATVATISVSPEAPRVRTEDRNRDGRPDLWRHYDRTGRLTEVIVDSNFDGRSDIQEFYDSRGAILRRESDRNFNGQVDLVEEFDPTTHKHARSVVDVDFDGRADLLVLFRDGQPVFSKKAPSPTPSAGQRHSVGEQRWQIIRYDSESLAPLADPFRSETTVRQVLTSSESIGSAVLSTAGGLPRDRAGIASPAFFAAGFAVNDLAPSLSVPLSPRAPRGPPLS
jgi:hypothetical protein